MFTLSGPLNITQFAQNFNAILFYYERTGITHERATFPNFSILGHPSVRWYTNMENLLKPYTTTPPHLLVLEALISYIERRRKSTQILDSVRLKSFLEGLVYTLHKLQNKRFPRRKTVSAGPRIILSCDLADLGALQKENHGVRYLLVCVDVLIHAR